MKKFFLILILSLSIVGFLLPTADVQAFSLMDGVSSDCWSRSGNSPGNCDVCDILRVVYNVGRLVFMSMAAIALALLLWAAIGLIFNWGSAELIARNKKLIFHTFLAILIIMIAYTLVNTTIFVLTGTPPGSDFIWQGQDGRSWWQGPTCE